MNTVFWILSFVLYKNNYRLQFLFMFIYNVFSHVGWMAIYSLYSIEDSI